MISFFLMLAVGAVGSVVFYRMKVPAGALMGAIITVGACQVLLFQTTFPLWLKVVVQAISGCFIGQKITRQDLGELRLLIRPALVIFLGIATISVITGLTIAATSTLDLATALLSCAPGGMSDMVLLATDLEANPAQTSMLQLTRYLVAVLVFPQIAGKLCAKEAQAHPEAVSTEPEPRSQGKKSWANAGKTALVTALSGYLGYLTQMPAGCIVLPMFAVAAFNVVTGRGYLPPKVKLGAQCVAGMSVGVSITMKEIMGLPELILPGILVLLSCGLIHYGLGFYIHKHYPLDLATSLFATIPAGLSDMALISSEFGGDAPKVSVLQLIRYFFVMTVMPLLIEWMTHYFG